MDTDKKQYSMIKMEPLRTEDEAEYFTFDYFPETHAGFVNDLYFEHAERHQNGLNHIELSHLDLSIIKEQQDKMNSIPFQRYKRFYGKAFLFGSFGCRWKRYQQSKADAQKWDLLWFCILVLVTCYSVLWMYFWAVCFSNDQASIDWVLYTDTGNLISWKPIILGILGSLLVYLVILMLLALTHVALGYELYMHKCHKLLVFLIASFYIAITVLTCTEYSDGWSLMYISLQLYGIYLQVAAVVILTALTWLIAGQWAAMSTAGCRLIWIAIYVSVMLVLYVSPVFIDSPCVLEPDKIPLKPKLFAHRGNSGYAPENTLIAFQQAIDIPAVIGLEADIAFTADDIPIVFHDRTLRRTTNIEDVYPSRARDLLSKFNLTDLESLSAGEWFVRRNPYGTVGALSDEQRSVYGNQSIPTLLQVLTKFRDYNVSFYLDFYNLLKYYPSQLDQYARHVERAIVESGIPPEKILWSLQEPHSITANYTRVQEHAILTPEELLLRNIHRLDTHYATNWRLLLDYLDQNISVNVYVVNSDWLYSYLWCAGVTSVTSNIPSVLTQMAAPILTMTPENFLVIWVTVTVTSFIVVVAIFAIQWHRKHGQLLEPEMASLHVVRHRISQIRRSKNMKEKLIRAAEGLQESPTAGFVGVEKDQSMNFQVPADAQSPVSSVPVTPTSISVSCETQDAAVTEETQSTVSAVSLNDIPADV